MDSVNWKIEENSTLSYLKGIQSSVGSSYYRKKTLPIRRFLIYLNINWAHSISLPSKPCNGIPKRITMDDIQDTLDYYSDHIYFKQIKAIINLGIYSGLRAEELYQLRLNDFDLSNCTVFANHNPSIGQSTKNKK